MSIKIAINGFGRIGRQAFKIWALAKKEGRKTKRLDSDEIEVVALNDLTDTKALAYLLKYDSIYGIYPGEVSYDEKNLIVDGQKYPVFAIKEPEKLPWKNLGVDIVLECTGRFENFQEAARHLQAGAKLVIISSPAKGEGQTLVLGTQETEAFISGLKSSNLVISNASCTTNCIAPVIQVLHSEFGVEKALMTTAHAYTATQSLVDGPQKDLRRGRAAAVNIVPSSTGAAEATTEVISELGGLFDGIALRVPVVDGSIADITAVLRKQVSVGEVNLAFKKAVQNPLFEEILAVSEEPLVSSDIIRPPLNSYSAIVDLEFTRVIGNLVKVLAWYDNEWGYSCRLVGLAYEIGKRLAD